MSSIMNADIPPLIVERDTNQWTFQLDKMIKHNKMKMNKLITKYSFKKILLKLQLSKKKKINQGLLDIS
jgi:hypothetical protein